MFHKIKTRWSWRGLRNLGLPFLAALLFSAEGYSQDTLHLSLQEVVQRGLDSSKTLKISSAEISKALERIGQAKDASLPKIQASAMASEAFLMPRMFQLPEMMKDPMPLPGHATLYMGNVNVVQPIFTGNQIKLAKKSAEILYDISDLNHQIDSQDLRLKLIQGYINLFTIDENQKIMDQELIDVQGRLDEVIQFRNNGLATDNDVLRFQLQKSRVQLNQIDLANNRAVANYALTVLLELPEQTIISVDSVNPEVPAGFSFETLKNTALDQRAEFNIFNQQEQLADLNIKKIKDERLPTVGISGMGYYINPNDQFIPPNNAFMIPLVVGLNVGWNISSLYTSKHKIKEAEIQRAETSVQKAQLSDKIKIDVQKQYRDFLQNKERIKVLETAVAQARENDRIMELKYQNQLASTTDRIDAQTMLYQSLVNLTIAKADVATSYYQLLRSTGSLGNSNKF